VILGFVFLTLAIASGLYYLSELVEEHTVLSKKLLIRLIQGIIATHALLLIFDGFPWMLTLFSAASHGVYLANVSRTFPLVKLTDGVFILSCLLVIANHFLWFKHFSNPPLPSDHPYYAHGAGYDYSSSNDPYFQGRYPTFTEISAFFGICVWLVPFALFVSLSAADNVLPTSSEIGGGTAQSPGLGGAKAATKKSGGGMAKMVFGGVKDYITSSGEALGVVRPDASSHARFD